MIFIQKGGLKEDRKHFEDKKLFCKRNNSRDGTKEGVDHCDLENNSDAAVVLSVRCPDNHSEDVFRGS